ncbi:protein bric-a-brac 2 isoform X2 [Anabrus simplex]|uniref:protein bric-a-brac 2 isoform X2 n=1 Tax=Anabrus simplex TaxID=316456 RepID=UPI0034DD914F
MIYCHKVRCLEIMAGQQICLKWNSFHSNIVTSFETLWEEGGLVDVTLASDGQCLKAHKVILSACSPFFRKVFQSNPCQHPVIILQDVHFTELESLLSFVYKGEVNIEQENLPALLRAAETLQIRGLSGASEQVKEKMGSSKKPAAVPNQESSLDGAPPLKRPRSLQQSQSPPLPSAPLGLTPTSRPSRSRHPSASSMEPWEHSQQACDPEYPPKVEPKDSESGSPSPPLLPMEEALEDSTDGSVEPLPELTESPGKLLTADTGQLKGISKAEVAGFHADPNYDPTQATKNFPYPPFPCPFCDRAYTSWGFRRRHIKAVHTQSPRLSCKWCLQVLPSHSDWEQHVMAEHNLSPGDAHNGLLILEEAHMVLQIPNPTRLDTFVSMIKKSGSNDTDKSSGSGAGQGQNLGSDTPNSGT